MIIIGFAKDVRQVIGPPSRFVKLVAKWPSPFNFELIFKLSNFDLSNLTFEQHVSPQMTRSRNCLEKNAHEKMLTKNAHES